MFGAKQEQEQTRSVDFDQTDGSSGSASGGGTSKESY
jgi:hypothetical protein